LKRFFMKKLSSWRTPVVGVAIALVVAGIQYKSTGSAAEAIAVLAIVGGYALGLVALRSRSETAGVLSGVVVDERYELIHQRALAFSAQVMAVVLVGAFVAMEVIGNDAAPYAWPAGVLGASYLAAMFWYRWRS
jgi:uncharacterized membrane protein